MSDSVKQIFRLVNSGPGRVRRVALYEERKKKPKKGTAGLRQIERFYRKIAESQRSGLDSYLERHRRSNTKKKDGWIRDFNDNVWKATRVANKKLPNRLI